MHDASKENVVFPYKAFPSVLFSVTRWKKERHFLQIFLWSFCVFQKQKVVRENAELWRRSVYTFSFLSFVVCANLLSRQQEVAMWGVAILWFQDPVSKMMVVREIQLLSHEALQCGVLREQRAGLLKRAQFSQLQAELPWAPRVPELVRIQMTFPLHKSVQMSF